MSRFYIGGAKPGSGADVRSDDPNNQRRLVFVFHEQTRCPGQGRYMDERREKRIETAIAWIGYAVVFLGLIGVLLLSLMRL